MKTVVISILLFLTHGCYLLDPPPPVRQAACPSWRPEDILENEPHWPPASWPIQLYLSDNFTNDELKSLLTGAFIVEDAVGETNLFRFHILTLDQMKDLALRPSLDAFIMINRYEDLPGLDTAADAFAETRAFVESSTGIVNRAFIAFHTCTDVAAMWPQITNYYELAEVAAAHELGHALGLAHDTKNTHSIMYPRLINPKAKFEPEDIDYIRYQRTGSCP